MIMLMLGILLLASQSLAANVRNEEKLPVTTQLLLSKINNILDKELQLVEHEDGQQQQEQQSPTGFSAADVADWFEAMHESQTTMTWGPCVVGSFFMANLPDSIDPNGGKMGCRAGEEDFLDGNFGQGTDGLKTKSGDVALCCVDSIFLGAIRTKQVTPEQVRGYYDTMFPTSGTTTTTTVCYQLLSIITMYHLLLAAVIIIIYCYHLLLSIINCCHYHYLLLSSVTFYSYLLLFITLIRAQRKVAVPWLIHIMDGVLQACGPN
jgi:hypothetical protein